MRNGRLAYYCQVILIVTLFLTGCKHGDDYYSRGIGVYPGNPSEDFSPVLVPDHDNYRNIARLRAAWHSSSYDYNLTAQLITDGIITASRPSCIKVSTNNRVLPKNERERLLDHNTVTQTVVDGSAVWIQMETEGDGKIPEINRIVINGSVNLTDMQAFGWHFYCTASNDGKEWKELGHASGSGYPGQERPGLFRRSAPAGNQPVHRMINRIFSHSFNFRKPETFRFYKIQLTAPGAESWVLSDLDFYFAGEQLNMTPSNMFSSTWMSAGDRQEWVYVDLGTISSFDNIRLYWIEKPLKGSIQVSDDAYSWSDIADLPYNDEIFENIELNREISGRFVRILMTESNPGKKFALSELEVYGRGGLVPDPRKNPEVAGNRMYLSAGNWRIQRASEVTGTGEEISLPGFDSESWVPATVPGTVLVSYLNEGAIPDPDYGDNQLMISESFFNSDFWYRNDFEVPAGFTDEKMFLNFDGINWKADVYINGWKTGRIEGAFKRGLFDVTDHIRPGERNSLAVLIHKNDNIGVVKEQTADSPDKNGGVLGADNPTFHASIGWDWIPTIRGRNTGIWNDVFLSKCGNVTISDPFVSTNLSLPDTTAADIEIEVTLVNHNQQPISGVLSGKYGDIEFREEVSIDGSSEKVMKLDPENHPDLHIVNPHLWWPNGYGAQNLYDVELAFESGSGVSDLVTFKSGIREMAYDVKDNILSIFINGRRFIGRGGNWGFPESNLRYRSREYDVAVAYHADMNFTMIRNWVGQTGDDEFYQACDRHGIMIWQDFWLANPSDGPDPDDPGMFIENAEDMIKRIRNHPSVAIYCGRNEGDPPPEIDSALRQMIAGLHPGLHYISNSAAGAVSGGGPYRALPPQSYFSMFGNNRLHSERGMPCVVNWESLEMMLPPDKLWPMNSQWGIHDYCLNGAQAAASFNEMVAKGFGKVIDARRFTELAQWISYNGYRAIFEGRSGFRKGMLLWMSHPAWPSMVWQTYDYYLDPTAAYFGCKKASEPVHIQWNPVLNQVEVVNYNAGMQTGLTAVARVINMDGSVKWEKEISLECREDSTADCYKIDFRDGLSDVHFIKLQLLKDNDVVSDNFYWRGREDGNYRALNSLGKAKIDINTRVNKSAGEWTLAVDLINNTNIPALMIRLTAIGKESRNRILPAFYSDNYVSLMPGESKTITIKIDDRDTRGEKPAVSVSGFNLQMN